MPISQIFMSLLSYSDVQHSVNVRVDLVFMLNFVYKFAFLLNNHCNCDGYPKNHIIRKTRMILFCVDMYIGVSVLKRYVEISFSSRIEYQMTLAYNLS